MKHNLIGLSGKAGSGKDEAYRIIKEVTGINYENKKFAHKLKLMVTLILGCSMEDLEDREFKNKDLGDEWACYKLTDGTLLPKGYYRIGTDNDICEARYSRRMTPRLLLQLLGTEGCREVLHPNIWVNALFADWIETHSDHAPNGVDTPYWVVTDCRFPNEAKAIQERGGVVIRINRPGFEDTGNHESETALDNYKSFNHIITNDGSIYDLENTIKSIIK